MVKMEMKKPSIWKRILAAITDFFLAFLLFGILFVFVVQPIYNKFTNYQKTVDNTELLCYIKWALFVLV